MKDSYNPRVVGDDGLEGVIAGPSDAGKDEVLIELNDGREISVPASALTRGPDGTWHVDKRANPERGDIVVPVLAERLEVGKRKVPTGAVRVARETLHRDEQVSMPLERERVDVRRVVVDRPIERPLAVRREGDTIIVPVVEEVPVVDKQLRLKEELHITRRRSVEQHTETVNVREQQAHVERVDAAGRPRPADVVGETPAAGPEHRSILDPTRPAPSVLHPETPERPRRRNKVLRED